MQFGMEKRRKKKTKIMKIQITTDNNITGREELAEQAEAKVERKLASAEIESKAKSGIERWENEGGGFSFPGQHPIKRRDFLV
jgi:hypothetical protein